MQVGNLQLVIEMCVTLPVLRSLCGNPRGQIFGGRVLSGGSRRLWHSLLGWHLRPQDVLYLLCPSVLWDKSCSAHKADLKLRGILLPQSEIENEPAYSA